MNVINKKITDIKPYEKNPRKNDEAVKYVEASIREFGFKVPIVIDKDGIIVAGHTRWKAAKKLGLDEVPCIIADDLNDEQIKAFRLADNKVSEKAEWDFDLLGEELDELFDFDMTVFGFEEPEDIEEFDESDLEREDEKDGNVLVQITFKSLQEYKNAEESIKNIVGDDANMVVRMV